MVENRLPPDAASSASPRPMFLFLSKLLPLLVYPLGLSLLLMALALIWIPRHPRRARFAIATGLAILWLSSTPLLRDRLVGSLEGQNLPTALPNADVILVLGGATKSAIPPRPWVDVSEEGDRILQAARLYQQGKAPKLLLSGGRIGWAGAGNSEAADMAELLKLMGVPNSAILQEPNSLNTRQNAIYSQKILAEQGLERILLVTSAMHMPRSLAIFRKLGLDVVPAPTDFLVARGDRDASPQARLLGLLPQAENLRDTTRAIKEYIGWVVYRLRGWL